jgi:radical SAM superfamily enzyme YgiQ (UPF0313 family)
MKKKLDILLINPPYERLKGFSLESIPNGILGLATCINQYEFSALVYDADTNYNEGTVSYNNKNRAERQNEYAKRLEDENFHVWREIRDTLEELDPVFVGISLMTPTIHAGLKIARIAKELGKIVLVGGPHVNIVKKEVLNRKEVDFAFFGESERSLLEFLRSYPDMEKLRHIKGIGFRKNGESIYNGFSDRIADLNTLPFPDRGLLLYRERYLETGLASIMASRGCPFRCSFCASVPIWGNKAVYRSPEHIVSEIRYLHDTFRIREFRFFDDTFTARKDNVINLCKLLVDSFGERYFSWWCLSRVNTVDEHVLSWLKKAGCSQIHLGVESGSDKVLKLMNKGITTEQVIKAVELAKRYKFWVHTFFMIGLPYETLEDIRETAEFIKKIAPDSVNLCTFTPYPGTELYDYCINKNILKHDDQYEIFKYIGHHSTENFFLEHVSREEYRKILNEMLELTTDISNSLTYRKLMYRFRNLTVKKAIRKINTKYHNVSSSFQIGSRVK